MLANAWGRNTLSMAMVCMVNATALAITKNKTAVNGSGVPEGCEDLTSTVSADYGVSSSFFSLSNFLLLRIFAG